MDSLAILSRQTSVHSTFNAVAKVYWQLCLGKQNWLGVVYRFKKSRQFHSRWRAASFDLELDLTRLELSFWKLTSGTSSASRRILQGKLCHGTTIDPKYEGLPNLQGCLLLPQNCWYQIPIWRWYLSDWIMQGSIFDNFTAARWSAEHLLR